MAENFNVFGVAESFLFIDIKIRNFKVKDWLIWLNKILLNFYSILKPKKTKKKKKKWQMKSKEHAEKSNRFSEQYSPPSLL